MYGPIKHSCRYCNHLANGDAPYCSFKQKAMTEGDAREQVDCEKFDFNPLDALWEKDLEDDDD